MVKAGGEEGVKAALEIIDAFSKGTFPKELFITPDKPAYRDTWQEIIKAAEKYNEPGRFTAFIGYEWTSQIAPGDNLHRVVIFRDGGARASQTLPYTTTKPLGSPIPEDLWKALQAYEDKTGGSVLAIAHNGNLSNGLMFPDGINFHTKQPLTKEYVETRARWEPLYEATQIKGDGEAHTYLSPNDEFAGYEIWDKGNLNLSVAKKPEMLKGEYARSALQIGLQHEQKLGTNPFKFGMIGSTDTHTSLATAEEDNFFGKHTGTEPSPERASHPAIKFGNLRIEGWQSVVVGLRRRLGAREHARGAVRRDAAPRNLRHHRPAHDRALLRRLGLRRGRCAVRACRPRPATPRACRWAATCAPRPPARRRASSWRRSRIRSRATSTASRSSRDGSTRKARARRRSTTSPGPATASPTPTASCRRSATRSMWRTPPGPTPSARRS